MINKHSIARLLLLLRYSPLGVWVNKVIKGFFPNIWNDLRNLAIIGHEPTLQKKRHFRLSFFKRGRRYYLKLMADDDAAVRARAFKALLGKKW